MCTSGNGSISISCTGGRAPASLPALATFIREATLQHSLFQHRLFQNFVVKDGWAVLPLSGLTRESTVHSFIENRGIHGLRGRGRPFFIIGGLMQHVSGESHRQALCVLCQPDFHQGLCIS